MAFQTDDNDAVALTTIRILAQKIEQAATKKYLTDRTTLMQILNTLTSCNATVKGGSGTCSDDADCPPHWKCRGNTCEPPDDPQDLRSADRQKAPTPKPGQKEKKRR